MACSLTPQLAHPAQRRAQGAFSVRWSNRRALTADSHTVRGQVGLAIDLDGVFK